MVASTVKNGIDRLRKGNRLRSHYKMESFLAGYLRKEQNGAKKAMMPVSILEGISDV